MTRKKEKRKIGYLFVLVAATIVAPVAHRLDAFRPASQHSRVTLMVVLMHPEILKFHSRIFGPIVKNELASVIFFPVCDRTYWGISMVKGRKMQVWRSGE